MSFISLRYLLFLPISAFICRLLPAKFRKYWLLAASYAFYLAGNPLHAAALLISTGTTFQAAKMIEKASENDPSGKKNLNKKILKKKILIGALVINIGIIFVCKYLNFFLSGLFRLTGNSYTPLKIILPAGIMFYILMAVGYLADVYKGKLKAEKDLVNYALFVSFFPIILSGPIERAGNMLPQIAAAPTAREDDVREGSMILLWGFFLKLVLADRIAILVNTVYAAPEKYAGTGVIIAVLMYSLQIYCDFYGYSCLAMGSARVLGYRVMENFDRPYTAQSIAEFWRRWHVSLSSWFRDYVYIPLGGNRKGTARKYLNILIVFAVSGLWHGAGLNFIVWGLLHGLYQIIGYLMTPARNALIRVLRVNRVSLSHKAVRIGATYLLVSFAWIFFRADNMTHAFRILHSINGFQPWMLLSETPFSSALDLNNGRILVAGLLILLFADYYKMKAKSVRLDLLNQSLPVRWFIYIAAFLIVVICGVWGPGYDASTFIYSRF